MLLTVHMIFYLKKKNNEWAVPDYHIWNTFKVSAQRSSKAILGPLDTAVQESMKS